jgi:uncharacterized membrane protein YdjX (TVP38/TMEM64 family)
MKSETTNAAESGPQIEPGTRSGLWRPLLLLGILLTAIVLARFLEVGQYLESLRGWIDSLGAWGPLVFILLYAAAVVMALPGSALTVVAGALFGSGLGIIVVSAAATLGASLSFLVARYFARDATASWLTRKETFRKLDQLTEERGAVIVALTRLVPIFPFNLLNYGFGLTRVPFWTYVFWSWLCMLPGTVLYVVGADAVTKAIYEGRVPWTLIFAVILSALFLAVVARMARARLRAGAKE